MRKYSYLLFIFSLFIMLPFNIKAMDESCLNSEITYYQELAKNINIDYDYIEDNESVNFSIKISNIQPNLLVHDTSKGNYYNYSSSEILLTDYKDGNNYRFDFIIESGPCSEMIVGSKYANLPSYNRFYKYDMCKGLENFKYCKKWAKVTLSEYEVKDAINKYKKNLEKEQEENNKNSINSILKFYLNYYYIILPIIILLGIFGIYRYNKKNDLF